MFSKLQAVLVFATVLSAVGCDGSTNQGDGSGGACGNFTACGGDVVGTWNVVGICFDDPTAFTSTKLTQPECQGAIRNIEAHPSGMYEFSADGHITNNVTFTIDLDALWTAACLKAIANGADVDLAGTCAEIEANYAQNARFAGASCVVEGADCSCMVTTVETQSTSNGPYTIDSTTITEDGEPSTYCVEGNTLKIHSMSAETSGTVTLSR